MGVIIRSKSDGAKFLEGYPQVRQLLQQERWTEFVEKFDGHEKEVKKSFARAYDGIEAEIGDMKLVLTNSFVEKATRFPRIRESWFKNRKIEEKECKFFLQNPGMDIYVLKKGIPITTLNNKWRNLIFIIKNFLTCECSFGNMFFYHARLMMNFLEGNEINLPYFLLHRLRKMSRNIHKKIYSIDNALYHHGLVKVLIEAHLKK